MSASASSILNRFEYLKLYRFYTVVHFHVGPAGNRALIVPFKRVFFASCQPPKPDDYLMSALDRDYVIVKCDEAAIFFSKSSEISSLSVDYLVPFSDLLL